ncbi:MAG: hypothetical protein WD424_09740 [Paenibacillaceae bacterium]
MLVQDVADNFDEVTISRGFQYYKQGRVEGLTMSAPQYIEACVQGSDEYNVEMNLDFFSTSHCDCPVEGFCKHMVAVLLDYASKQGRPVNMLVNAKSIVVTKPSFSPSAHTLNYSKAVQLAAKKSESKSKLMEHSAKIPTMSVIEWHELFEQRTSQLPQNIRSFEYVEHAMKLILQLKPKLANNVEHFYMLNVHLFVLSKLIPKRNHYSGHFYSQSGHYADPTITDMQETIETYFTSGDAMAVKPDNQSLLQQTLAYIRGQMLMESSEKRYFLDVYHSYWHYWICPYTNDSKPYTEELLKLEQAGRELGSSLSRFQWLMAQAWMSFYMAKDEEAWMLLKDAKTHTTIPSDMSMYFLYSLSQQQQWNRLLNWLTILSPLFRSYRRDYLYKYMEFWELAVNYLPDAEKSMWDTLVAMLPYSRPIYEEKLVQQGRWKQWMDYHLSMGSDPSEFRVSELQPMEKNAPEVLLPFYHHAVERYVMHKNRDGYKAAVKLLKRLAKLYRKIKLEERWELYLTAFISRYSRLRALQEELRKGKLLQ